MSNTKQFPIEVVLSLTTGRLLCDFSQLHEMIEWIAGHPVWTHELADKNSNEQLVAQVHRQHPLLLEAEQFSSPPRDHKTAMLTYIKEYVERAVAKFGKELSLEQGDSERTEHPISSFFRIKDEISTTHSTKRA